MMNFSKSRIRCNTFLRLERFSQQLQYFCQVKIIPQASEFRSDAFVSFQFLIPVRVSVFTFKLTSSSEGIFRSILLFNCFHDNFDMMGRKHQRAKRKLTKTIPLFCKAMILYIFCRNPFTISAPCNNFNAERVYSVAGVCASNRREFRPFQI